jgi:hypothetical protein
MQHLLTSSRQAGLAHNLEAAPAIHSHNGMAAFSRLLSPVAVPETAGIMHTAWSKHSGTGNTTNR